MPKIRPLHCCGRWVGDFSAGVCLDGVGASVFELELNPLELTYEPALDQSTACAPAVVAVVQPNNGQSRRDAVALAIDRGGEGAGNLRSRLERRDLDGVADCAAQAPSCEGEGRW